MLFYNLQYCTLSICHARTTNVPFTFVMSTLLLGGGGGGQSAQDIFFIYDFLRVITYARAHTHIHTCIHTYIYTCIGLHSYLYVYIIFKW